MTRTEYTRQVAIKHWLPVTAFQFGKDALYLDAVFLHQIPSSGRIQCEEVITGYKQQRAWKVVEDNLEQLLGWIPSLNEREMLLRGEEVEGFKWIDEPVVSEE